jgi:hypothetical protein
MAADTSIVPVWTMTSWGQYVIGRDNGLNDQPIEAHPTAPYTNSDAAATMFLAQISSAVTIDFESFADNTSVPFAINFTTTTATFSGGTGLNLVKVEDSGTTERGRYAAYGTKFFEANTNWTISFSVAARAIGFYGIDLGDWTGNLSLFVTYSDATTETISVSYTIGDLGLAPYNQSMTYYGAIFTKDVASILFNNTDVGYDVFGFDNVTAAISSQISEPPMENPQPTPPASLDCGPSMGPAVCTQSCPIPTPTWSPLSPAVVSSAAATFLATCGHSIGRSTC